MLLDPESNVIRQKDSTVTLIEKKVKSIENYQRKHLKEFVVANLR